MMTAFRIEDLPIESQMLTNALDEAQRKVIGKMCGVSVPPPHFLLHFPNPGSL